MKSSLSSYSTFRKSLSDTEKACRGHIPYKRVNYESFYLVFLDVTSPKEEEEACIGKIKENQHFIEHKLMKCVSCVNIMCNYLTFKKDSVQSGVKLVL